MTSISEPTNKLTSLALEAIQQRFPDEEIKALYIKLIRKPKEENVIKVQLSNNTFWLLKQTWQGNMKWKQIDVR